MQKITFKQLLSITKAGIGSAYLKRSGPFPFAYMGGGYLGAPGREIYCCLSRLSDDEMQKIASLLALHFPLRPPGDNHVRWAACIREIYGIDPPGYLLSKNKSHKWELPEKFIMYLKKTFEDIKCYYGLVIWNEMFAHRLGDKAIINQDQKYLNDMVRYYNKTARLALSIKSWKHTFTPFYWAAFYFGKMNEEKKCIQFYKKTLLMMDKYCPSYKGGYKQKGLIAYKQLRCRLSKEEFEKLKNKLRNKKMRRMLRLQKK